MSVENRLKLANIRRLGNFTTLENWDIQISSAPDGIKNPGEVINLRAESMDRPSKTNSINQIQIRGLPPVYQHGITTPSGSTTITLFSTVDMEVEKLIKDLMDTAGYYGKDVKQGRYKHKSELEITATLRDVENNALIVYTFTGCLIESFDPGGGFGATSDLAKPSITFKWDDYSEVINYQAGRSHINEGSK